MRGYCEIGVYHTKHQVNIGTLWRSAYQCGASGVFTIGKRYQEQASDTCKTTRHLPLRHYLTLNEWHTALPHGALVIGVEMGGEDLWTMTHPAKAVYLLGAEDHGLPPAVRAACHRIVSLKAVRIPSYNVAVAGSIVLYHRLMQMHQERS